jgi:hypothetical protein
MARVRNNQGISKKDINVFMRPYLEQENTQEREALSSSEGNYKTSAR